MDKLQMAHEYLLRFNGVSVEEAWEYADAMQAEADKRKPSGLPEVLREEWQPDWSQAPDWATAWSHDRLGSHWWDSAPKKGFDMWIPSNSNSYKYDESPDFNYQGNWQDSLRKRPQ